MVQNGDIALAPYQPKALTARHARDVGAAVACGVNQVGGAEVAGGRMEHKAVGMLVDRIDRGATPEFDAVRSGVLGGGDGDFKGVDVAGRGAPQRAGGFLARAGLYLEISSSSMMRMSSTPLARPFSSSFSRCSRSAGEKPSTMEPVRLKPNPSSFAQRPYSAQPRALTLALTVPAAGSYPAWTRPPFAFVEPSAMSLPASTQAIARS